MSVPRTTRPTDEAFQFIVSNGPRVDPASRTMIRKQAMKNIGLDRRHRNHNKFTRNQPGKSLQTLHQGSSIVDRSGSPVSSTTSSSDASNASTFGTELTELDDVKDTATGEYHTINKQCTALNPSLGSAAGSYWKACANSAIDLSRLTILTRFNVSRSTISSLAESSSRLPTIFNHRQWSYLEYIPQRYSHSPCLAAATDCILAKVSNILAPRPAGEKSVLRLYAKALQLVQAAITSSSCTDPDVLCAIQLLSLHELFDTTKSEGWASHVEGSAMLIRHRSAERFETEFEKALLAASVGPYVSECLYAGKHCYLAESPWKELYLNLAVDEPEDSLSERSALVVGLRSQLIALPGLWSDVGHALEGDDLFSDDVLSSLTQRCQEAQAGYLASLEDYKAHMFRTAFSQPSSNVLALRREVFSLAHEGLILVKRLQASVSDPNRLELEGEVQILSQTILSVHKQPLPQHSWLFNGHEFGIAQLAVDTRAHFTEDVSTETWEYQRIAMRMRYMLWSSLLRAI